MSQIKIAAGHVQMFVNELSGLTQSFPAKGGTQGGIMAQYFHPDVNKVLGGKFSGDIEGILLHVHGSVCGVDVMEKHSGL